MRGSARQRRLVRGIGLAGFSVVCCLTSAILASAATSDARAMLDAVNSQRRALGRSVVTLDARLTEAAAVQARDLARRGVLDHRGSDGSTVGDRVTRAGYRWSVVAENLARMGTTSARPVVAAWMKSTGHRRNLLKPDVTQIGVAHVGHVWVLVLGRRAPPR